MINLKVNAPAAMPMIWEGRMPGQICRQLKDPNRTTERLSRRSSSTLLKTRCYGAGTRVKVVILPPLCHAEFAGKFQEWERFGAACPN
jgi:hypothetical protein